MRTRTLAFLRMTSESEEYKQTRSATTCLGEFTPSKTLKLYMREWRNWQTRTFEGRVVHTVRVQVPFLAPNQKNGIKDAVLLVLYELTMVQVLLDLRQTYLYRAPSTKFMTYFFHFTFKYIENFSKMLYNIGIAEESRTNTPCGEQFSRLAPDLVLQDAHLASTRFDKIHQKLQRRRVLRSFE